MHMKESKTVSDKRKSDSFKEDLYNTVYSIYTVLDKRKKRRPRDITCNLVNIMNKRVLTSLHIN